MDFETSIMGAKGDPAYLAYDLVELRFGAACLGLFPWVAELWPDLHAFPGERREK